MNLFSNLDAISKASSGLSHDLDEVLIRIAEKRTLCMRLSRINVWMFRNSQDGDA
jgi:hypothetical protein